MKIRQILAALLLVATLIPASFGEEPAVAHSLTDRRALKAYQEATYPALLQSIQKAAKFEVPVEVDWNAIAIPGGGANYKDDGYWTVIFFKPLATALAKVTADDLGAESLRSKLKKIKITYNSETAPLSNYPTGVTFAEGLLTINFQPYSSVDDEAARSEAIFGALDKGL